MELRQSLVVSYVGKGQAMLIFSDFFEEAVENTPARILVTNTHGCGKQYRNAFVRTQFQFHEYDSLFPYVKVQEPESLVCRLALGRLMFPYELESAYQNLVELLAKQNVTFGTYLWVPDYNGLDDYIWEFCMNKGNPPK